MCLLLDCRLLVWHVKALHFSLRVEVKVTKTTKLFGIPSDGFERCNVVLLLHVQLLLW